MAEPPSRGRKLTGFAIGDYAGLLTELLDKGYEAVGLEQIEPARRHLFLRHDVDLCLERALPLARVERELGLSSIYYVLVSTGHYNVASAQGRRLLREIQSLGHAIGLHFDATQYPNDREALDAGAREEIAILEGLTGQAVDSVSFHRPAPELLGMEDRFAGLPHTYEPRFFRDIGYISDSKGAWHHGHPLDHPAVRQGTAIQLLTHPIWWHSAAPTPAADLIAAYREERHAALIGDSDYAKVHPDLLGS